MGPSRDGRLKPELYAPGQYIMSSRSAYDTSSYWMDNDSSHTLKSGTSFAAPHVAGLVALMLDKNPEVTRAEILDCLQSTSSNGIDGIVNAYDAIDCVPSPPCQGKCGDANADGTVNSSDIVYITTVRLKQC